MPEQTITSAWGQVGRPAETTLGPPTHAILGPGALGYIAPKSEPQSELTKALVKAQKEIKSAHKDSENPFFKSKYADLRSIWDACKEALNNNGLAIVQTLDVIAGGSQVLKTKLLHVSGESIEGQCLLINLKADMQGLGSAISYARRYSLAAMVGVVTEDDDAEGAGKASDIKSFSKKEFKIDGDHVITFGKFKDKKVKDVPTKELKNYLDFLYNAAKRDGKEFGGEARAIDDYLKSPKVDAKTGEIDPKTFDDLPF